MPKVVDHEERRREIITATWKVMVSKGLANTTTREIAREAGCSTGVLAHYFDDRAHIVSSALVRSHADVRKRTDARVTDLHGLEALRILLTEALPLDTQRLREAQTEVCFWGEAIGNPELLELQNREVDRFAERIRRVIQEAQAHGEVSAELDVERAVQECLVLIDGVSIQAVLYPVRVTVENQLALLDGLLERLASR